jgi:hypothetical protein
MTIDEFVRREHSSEYKKTFREGSKEFDGLPLT